jgi:regulatory protein
LSSSAKQVAVKLLARREHSATEIRHKLQQRDFSPDEIAEALVDLQQGDWQSDERFAEAYIRARRLKGFGPVRIAMELNERGVDESIVSRCLHRDDDIWVETMREQYQRKYKGTEPDDYHEKTKRMRFLQYRGFPPEKIRGLIK